LLFAGCWNWYCLLELVTGAGYWSWLLQLVAAARAETYLLIFRRHE
jgi:hypothetical protein